MKKITNTTIPTIKIIAPATIVLIINILTLVMFFSAAVLETTAPAMFADVCVKSEV